MGDLLQPWHLLVLLTVSFFLFVLPFWQIFKKAGFPAPLSLLMIVPFVSLILLYVLAFADWPVLRKLEQRPGQFPPLP